MAIAKVQSISGISTGTVTNFALAYGSNTTAGSLLIATGGVFDGGAGAPTITDSQGNTWTVANGLDAGTGKDEFFAYLENCPGGALTVTVHAIGGGQSGFDLALYEFSGVALSGVPQNASSVRYATTTTPTTTAFTPTGSVNGALYFAKLTIDAAATITKNAAFTQGETPTALRNDEYLIQSASASLAASWAVAPTTRGTWYIYVFLPAAGGGGRTLRYNSSLDGLSSSGPKQFYREG